MIATRADILSVAMIVACGLSLSPLASVALTSVARAAVSLVSGLAGDGERTPLASFVDAASVALSAFAPGLAGTAAGRSGPSSSTSTELRGAARMLFGSTPIGIRIGTAFSSSEASR